MRIFRNRLRCDAVGAVGRRPPRNLPGGLQSEGMPMYLRASPDPESP